MSLLQWQASVAENSEFKSKGKKEKEKGDKECEWGVVDGEQKKQRQKNDKDKTTDFVIG